jgi:protein TonB
VAAAPALPAPPAPPPAPKIIPASAVQYLEPIVLRYPRLSQRNGETGRVLIRVYIDEAGLAKNVQVNRSSGHPRLDDAALAAVQKARFKPYTENGAAVAGWAYIPLDFELEK